MAATGTQSESDLHSDLGGSRGNADLARRLANLDPARRADLAERLRSRRDADTSIRRRDRHDPHELSFAQRRLWFLEQWTPNTHAYNAAFPLRIHGDLDVAVLEQALSRVVERHEALRTVVVSDGDEPRPVLKEASPVKVPIVDLTALSTVKRALAAERIVSTELRRPFVISEDQLLRARLVRLDHGHHLLVLLSHHIACDGWSKNVLFDELGEFYSAAVEGRAPDVPELQIQYSDYANWQRRRLSGRLLDDLTEYWRGRLAGAPAAINTPIDRPRPASRSFRGAVRRVCVSRELTERARRLGRSEGTTLYMTLLAVYGVFLWARTDQDDLVVGSPIAGREHVETEQLIGFFANTLPMRVELDAGNTFRELMLRVQRSAVGAYAHRELPFEQVVQAIDPPRDRGRNPICQVNFRVEAPDRPPSMSGLGVSLLDADPGLARFELAIELQEEPAGGLAGYLEYDTDLFTPGAAASMADDYGLLVEALLKDPDTPLQAVGEVKRVRARPRPTSDFKEEQHDAA